MSISPVDPTSFGGSDADANANATAVSAELAPRVDGPAAALELELMVLEKSVDAPAASSVDLRV